MSEPLNDHLNSLMHGEAPSEEDLRKQFEVARADLGEEDQSESESVEDSADDDSSLDESEDAETEDGLDDEGEDDYEEDEDDDEPMTPEQMQAALKEAQEARDEARREADGRLAALKDQRTTANELKGEIESLKDMVSNVLPEEPEEPEPDKNEDPLGYIAWQQENLVKPLVNTVEGLQSTIQDIQFEGMLNQVEGGVNAHIADTVGKNKMKEKAFLSARDHMIEGYKKHFVEVEGVSEEEAVKRIRVIAAHAGATAINEGGNFVDLVIEEAKKAGWKPPAGSQENPVNKVRKGQKTNRQGNTSSKSNSRRGRRITKAMMEARDGSLTHDEKLAIIGNDDHRRSLIEKGYTYIVEK